MQVRPPTRATRRRTIDIDGDADVVFRLLCPVRETEWLESWNPEQVYSDSGLAEPQCVFTSADGDRKSTWIITDHEVAARRVRMVKCTPGFTVCLLELEVAPREEGRCALTVCYSHTALSPAGAQFVGDFTESAYDDVMSMWQRALNHYLAHGTALPGS